MVTFKNTDISAKYNVSNPTVMRWIESAAEGNNNLQIVKVKNKFKVIKNENNQAELLRLSQNSSIYKNKIQKLDVYPDKEIYNIFNDTQIVELINCLKTKKYIPLKFSYLNGGAKIWDKYVKDGLENGTYVVPKTIGHLLEQSLDFILRQTQQFKKINIIDMGAGNSITVKKLLQSLLEKGKMGSYVSVDISKELLDISCENVKNWFPSIEVVPYVADIEKSDISPILFHTKKDTDSVNVLLFLGGALGNVEDRVATWKNLRESLDDEDLLIVQNKLDLEENRVELSHVADKQDRLVWIPKMLGLDVNSCQFVRRYDTKLESRALFIIPDKDYNINFNSSFYSKTVSLLKGQEVLIWNHHMSTLEEVASELKQSGLNLLHYTTQINNILVVCGAV